MNNTQYFCYERGIDLQERCYIKKKKFEVFESSASSSPLTSEKPQAAPGGDAGLEAATELPK